MDFLPVFLDLKNRPCIVIGGGEIAARKVALLMHAGALVTVVTLETGPAIKRLAEDKLITLHEARFSPGDLEGFALAVAATDDAQINQDVSAKAHELNIPVNVVDQPELCSFIMPSVIDRSPVQIAVSTGGASPVLARLLRARLESMIPASYGRLAQLVAEFREQVKQRFTRSEDRRIFWENILQGSIAEMLFAGQEPKARIKLQEAIDSGSSQPLAHGEVYLVGAGPGDPDLLTFRALRLMQQADVVLYDRLVADAIVELTRRDAERIYVGKERDSHAVPQEKINSMLVSLAKEGRRVLRLKGGDPFIFGRGGEEIDMLAQENIPFQVVPGVTAASGCACYSGIPLTHRDHAQSCVFVTGHLRDGTLNLNWDALVQPAQTIVFYMGLKGIDCLCRELVNHGMAPDTPAALIEQGTTLKQRVIIGDLSDLADKVGREDVHAPTLIIVGSVVSLHDKLAWFEPRASH